jgi:SAM-dependent methyltransferase
MDKYINTNKLIAKTIHEFLTEKYKNDNLEIIKSFYPEYYHDSKNQSQIVGWDSKKEQDTRFKVLLNIGFKNGDTILDFGCGLGALYEYMSEKYNKFGYVGVDINDDFIEKCKNKYPNVMFKTIKDINDVKLQYDWFISSGAFTVYTPIKDMMQTIKIGVTQAKYGVGVNFLESTYAKNSDLEAIRGYDKKEMYKLFMKEFGEFTNIEIIDDYLKNDFTIYITKIIK